MKTFFMLYLLALAIQDLKTMYISKKWIPVTILFSILLYKYSYVDPLSRLFASFVYGIVSAVLYKWKSYWLGSADVIFLFLFGFLLGYERMMIAMLIALIIGFIWILGLKKDKIPFLSCLCIGVIISILHGYTIYYHLIEAFI